MNQDAHVIESRSAMELDDRDFHEIRRMLYESAGISLGTTKKQMVISRLGRRLRARNCRSYSEYLRLLQDEEQGSPEWQEFINCLTTNKTDFYRESHHFDYLKDLLIPQMKAGGQRKLRIWSAGCSTGEEPYTLAITLREACPEAENWSLEILASDIDSQVLEHASRGIYQADKALDIPDDLLKKYFLRGTGRHAGTIAAKPVLKELIDFKQVNLIEDSWPVQGKFDVIFCRNVVIYFDRPTQEKLFKRYAEKLNPGGKLILGHSENIHWMSDHFKSIGATIYESTNRKRSSVIVKTKSVPPVQPKLPVKSIILGDVETSRTPIVLKTLLGSCISACLYDPGSGIGGMNHFSLPGVSDEGVSARYGAHAMELLITAIMKKGGDRQRLRAKIFGGASLLRAGSEHFNVGARNSEFVRKFLTTEGIPIDGQCLGGTHGLLVKFQPHSGKAAAKPLANNLIADMLQEETQYTKTISTRVEQKPAGDIELF